VEESTKIYEECKRRFFVVAGPCVIESESLCYTVAELMKKVCEGLDILYIFKSSYDKANRTSLHSFRGPGLGEGAKILQRVKESFSVPVLTDVHSVQEAEYMGKVVDILQVPAFLCRQTDIVAACAKSQKIVNVKKGQFLSPVEMGAIVKKIEFYGNKKILLTERGTFFGYHNLVVDIRSIPIMREFGYPVLFDATHSVQRPGAGEVSGGDAEFVHTLAQAAVAAGCDGVFLEVHPNPEDALCDKDCMLPLGKVKELLKTLLCIHDVVKDKGRG
jgi:2-dehydro-3-deoxyphosphooctonate aldolase (KDO 8-P synthase)